MSEGPSGGVSQFITAVVNAFRQDAMKAMLNDPKHEDLLNFLLESELEKEQQKTTKG